MAAALDSLAWCQNIVVVDSGSTDGTVELARGHASRPQVIHQDWLGYSQQRKFAVDQCANEWVLMLDGDEECDARLIGEIQALTEGRTTGVAIFKMKRRNYMAGRHVRCWGPDWQTRLICRGRTEWDDTSIPEVRRPKAGFSETAIGGALLHNRVSPFEQKDLCDGPQMEHYATVLAESMAKRGKHATIHQLFWRPILTFLKYYILKLGFLDGRLGLVIAYKTTIGVMLKYTVLYARELKK